MLSRIDFCQNRRIKDFTQVDTLTNWSKYRWLAAIEARIRHLLSLQENWDSYNAPRIEPSSAGIAFEILDQISSGDTPVPQLFPTTQGTIQAEWDVGGAHLEVDFVSDERIEFYFEDATSNEVREGVLGVDLRELQMFVEQLSKPSRAA